MSSEPNLASAEHQHQNLASKAEGRVISGTVHFKLTPPQDGELGETDAANAIGIGLIREAMCLLKTTAEREGFEVDITYNQIIY